MTFTEKASLFCLLFSFLGDHQIVTPMRHPANQKPAFLGVRSILKNFKKSRTFFRFSFRTHFRFVVGLVTVSSSGSSNLIEGVFTFKNFSSIFISFFSLRRFAFALRPKWEGESYRRRFLFQELFFDFFAFLFPGRNRRKPFRRRKTHILRRFGNCQSPICQLFLSSPVSAPVAPSSRTGNPRDFSEKSSIFNFNRKPTPSRTFSCRNGFFL